MNTLEAISDSSAVSTLMSQPVTFLPRETKVVDALSRARELRVHHIPIGDANAPLGVLCTCDLREAGLSDQLGDLLSRPAISIELRASLREAADAMRTAVVGSLLVADGASIVGIVTRSDIVRSLGTQTSLAEVVCFCCGSDQHLKLDEHEQLLCVDCRERASEPHSFDEGRGG